MQKPLIIIGDGNVGCSDIERLQYIGEVVIIGSAISRYPGDIYAYAARQVDAVMFNTALHERMKDGLDTTFLKFSFFTTSGFEHRPVPTYGAGDVMYAIQLGLSLGFTKIVLVDCPLDEGYESFQAGFKEAFPSLKDNVRSLSGFTKELFGEPDDEWINNDKE